MYVIGLHAVQFGNNWMKKISWTAKIGGCRRPSRMAVRVIISKLDKHVVFLSINYIGS